MSKTIIETQVDSTPETMGTLEALVREGARKMLQAALREEIEEHLERYKAFEAVHCEVLAGRAQKGGLKSFALLTILIPLPLETPTSLEALLSTQGSSILATGERLAEMARASAQQLASEAAPITA